MSLDTIRARVLPLKQLTEPTTIELKRVEKLERLEKVDAQLRSYDQELAEKRANWELRKAKANTAAKLRNLPKYPEERKYHQEARQLRDDLLIELGEIPEVFNSRVRPVLSEIEFPPGDPPVFKPHTWQPLPDAPAGALHRGKGPGENKINAMTGGTPPIGGRCDHAFPGRKTGETKATDDNTFRGGATSRKNVNLVRRRIEAMIVQVRDLMLFIDKLCPEDQLRLRYANHLLNAVDESLLYGNMHDVDWQEFYTSIEMLNLIRWDGVPELYREDPFIRHPQGIRLFCRYLDVTMMGGKCFFTDWVILVRPMDNPTECLFIPQEDYDKTIRFLHLSKGDAHFKYFQPASEIPTMKIGLVPGAFKPYHAGHDAVIRLAAEENDRVMVFVSLSDRENVNGKTMERVWREQIQPTLPNNVQVFYGGSPVGEIYKLLGKANEEKSSDTFSIYSDPTDAAENYKTLDRYAGTLVANGQVKTRAIERSSTVDVSGTQMRRWLASGDKVQFIKNLPKSVDGEAVWSLLAPPVCQPAAVHDTVAA